MKNMIDKMKYCWGTSTTHRVSSKDQNLVKFFVKLWSFQSTNHFIRNITLLTERSSF
jgi:hypothetical protein